MEELLILIDENDEEIGFEEKMESIFLVHF